MQTTPTLGGPDLRGKLTETDDNLTGLRADAQAAWGKLDEAKAAAAAVSGELTPDSPEFAALDAAGKAYGAVTDRIAGVENVKATLVNALIAAGEAPTGATMTPSGTHRAQVEGQREQMARSAGYAIVDSPEYAALLQHPALKAGSKAQLGAVALGEAWGREATKALLTGADPQSGGAFVQPDRVGYYGLALRQPTILDLITIGDTDSDLVEYVKQTSFTNAAAPVPEATAASGTSGSKPMSDMRFTVEKVGVATVAHWVAATKRALADAGQLRTLIDGALRYGLDYVLEAQVIAGDGEDENLRGILETDGILHVPAGTASHADKIHHALTQGRLKNHEATGVAMNPLDWETVRLSRENTGGQGAYLLGGPTIPGPQTLWGKPVATSAAIPQGTALVGDFRQYILWMREGTQVVASDSHENFFTRNLVAVLAELRAAGGMPMPESMTEVDLATA